MNLVTINTWTQEQTQIANPASVNCTQKGGTSEIITNADGSQSGLCHLTDGTTCDEWAYYRWECPAPVIENTWIVETPTTQPQEDQSNIQKVSYPGLGITFDIPKNRTSIITDNSNPNIPQWILKITTDKKDDKWYSVYMLLDVSKTNINKLKGDLLDTDYANIQSQDNKLFELRWIPGYWAFAVKIGTEFYRIEIYDFTSEQPIPANADWPFYPNMIQISIDDVKSIISTIHLVQ